MHDRSGYQFNQWDKQYAHDRANGSCEFPGGCERPNNGIVHHLTGIGIARRAEVPRDTINDPKQNALMQCDLHTKFLDTQEKVIFESL